MLQRLCADPVQTGIYSHFALVQKAKHELGKDLHPTRAEVEGPLAINIGNSQVADLFKDRSVASTRVASAQ